MFDDRYLAHRGLFNSEKGIPENSLLAFKRAVENGYGMELDVHLTKDGKLVVVHDSNLLRMTGENVVVEELTYDEIKELRLSGTDEKIPLLKEVLKLVDGKVPLLIEIKYSWTVGVLEERLLKLMKNYKGEWAMESFDPFRVLWFRLHAPEIPRGQLITHNGGDFKFRFIQKLASLKFFWKYVTAIDFLSHDIKSVTEKTVLDTAEEGVKLVSWTVNSDELLENAEVFSDIIIFENCESMGS